MTEERNKLRLIGTEVLIAFFVGRGLGVIAVSQGGGSDLSRGVAQLLILGIYFIYSVGWWCAVLVQYLKYRKRPDVNLSPVVKALFLHAGAVVGLIYYVNYLVG